jgi:hypothetical protein
MMRPLGSITLADTQCRVVACGYRGIRNTRRRRRIAPIRLSVEHAELVGSVGLSRLV